LVGEPLADSGVAAAGPGLDDLRQPVHIVHEDLPQPGEVVLTDVVESDLLGLHAERRGELPLDRDRHVA
jgi:hypothetical protein